jgi:hypothetical protein
MSRQIAEVIHSWTRAEVTSTVRRGPGWEVGKS